VADCNTYSDITVVLYSSDVEKYWTQLILTTEGCELNLVNNEDYEITFWNHSTIQVQKLVEHDQRSQCEIEGVAHDRKNLCAEARN